MVRYPDGRCPDCGERLFARAEGSDWCPNCVQLQSMESADPFDRD